MTVSQPYQEGKLQKQMKNAITACFQRYPNQFRVAGIDFEGGGDEKKPVVAVVLVYRDNPQEPLTVRVSQLDLGENAARWPHILAEKASKVIKQVNAREGRSKTKITSLDDKRI